MMSIKIAEYGEPEASEIRQLQIKVISAIDKGINDI